MASGFPEKTSTPRLLSRERLTSFTLLPPKFLWEKFLNMKKKASTGGSFLPRIGPCVDLREISPKLPSDPPKQNLFQISPPEVVFQNFDPHGVSEMVLSLTNVYKFPQVVKVSMESSPYFQLTCSNDAYRVVPPGASALVRIRFTPNKNKDYSHELVCVTERERIVVPIRAIGARAILDFPDQLDFSKCPVKCSTQKTLLVRNVGNQAARYRLSTQSPFSVMPAIGILDAGDTMQVTVGFHPLTTGDHCGSLAVCCSTGEENIHTKLRGEAVDVNAGLSTNSMEFEKTFITMSSHKTMLIENRSNITAHFQWKAFPTEKGEIEEKRRQHRFLRTGRELWLEKLPEERETEKEKGSCEDHAALLKLPGEMAKLQQDPMLFSDDIFFIEPMEGEIGPNCSAEIKVTFKPLETLEYLSVAYCSISGCESRLPLCLTGEGQGPLIEFSSPRVNLGNVSVDTPHIYEVELINLGAIDAPFTYIPSSANVGFCFKLAPKKGIIAAGGSQIIQIFFSATVLGRFEEEFQFSVAGSPMSAILTITGCVTELSSHFDVNELDFGDISPGSTYTKTSCLTNTSPVSRASLWGEAHSPNLQIQPSSLESGCLMRGTEEEVHSLKMTNCSSLPVQYHWSICSDSQGNRLRCEPYPSKFQPQPPKGKRPCLDSLASLRRRFKIRNVEEPATALKESWDFAQSSGAEVPSQTPEHPQLPGGLSGIISSLDAPHTPLEAEKAFAIVPHSGVLQPGERQQVSFTCFGHQDIITGARALCCVEGGPTYKVELIASRINYSLSLREINCGLQMFNEVGHSTISLENTGRSEFSWVLIPCPADKHLPGVFLVKPTTGFIAPGQKQVLKFSYLPTLPGAFSRTYQLQVGDLEPENIWLKGEAICPMISVNLPWNIRENGKDEKPLKQPKKYLQQYKQRNKLQDVQNKTQSPKNETLKSQTLKTQTPKTQTLETWNPKTQDLQPFLLGSGIAPNTQLQINMVRMLIEKAALELQKKLTSHPLKCRFPDKHLCQSLVKVELPEYVLDMGTVLKGFTESSTLEITNPGKIPVFFQVNVSVLQDTGFSVDWDQMNGLLPRQSVALNVRFESTHQPPGDVDVLLPIEVTKGPTSHIHLRATVLEVSLDVSKRRLQFSDILVGQCQVETIRLYNWFQVPCTWFITASKPIQKRSYKNELKLNICGSSNYLKLHLSGQGLEPRLEFSPPALKMGPVLVDSNGVEATVVVKNPCNFPIEFYSLDFDEQYLEEEKILWMALGSEHQKSFLMPPRAVDGTLPPQVLEDCEAQKLKTQQAKLKARAKAQPSTANKGQKPKENVKKVKQKCGGQRSLQSSQLETQSQVAEGTVRDEHVGVPCLDMQDTHSKAMIWEILRDGKLPTKDQAKAPDAKGSSAKGQPKMGKAARRDSSSKENQISTQRIEDPQNSSTKRSKSMLKSASVATEFLRVVFPQWRKTMKEDEVIFKEYVESTKQFHFGPLLCGKSREWYKAQNCPSNSENLTILNNSPVDVEVQFSFENAGEAETFLLDPPSMILKPKEKQELTIWAYPTSPGFLEDKLICSIGKNPDPVVFSLCCHGVDLKLEVSPLELSFDKLLLYRTASRTLVLKNNTLLPMAWQLRGLVDLIEDFSLSQDSGIIDPHTEFEVTLHFQARQTGSIEKTLRLEVSDTENILGVVQAENIKISAEVYDVSLSIDMPEAVRGNHIEFGHCPVGEPCWRALTITSHAQTKVMRFEWEADAPIQFSPKVGHLHPGWAKDITVTLRSDVPATFRRHLVKCKVTTINFELPQRKVQDWDDQMTIAMWKNTTRKDPVTRWPKIERVVKAVPEPAHTVVEESSQEVEVYISAVVAYAQFQLSTDRVQFKDTFPFQRRTATFMMHNTGEVALKYSWEKVEESEPVKKPFSTTLMRRFLSYNTAKNHKKLLRLFWWEQEDHPAERPPKVWRPAKQQQDSEKQQQQDSKQQEEQVSEQKQEQSEQQDHSKKLRCSKQKNLSPRRVISSLEVFPDVIHDLFSINPYRGTIAPGQKQTFHLQFSPKHTGKFKATLLCRIPNLEPAQKMGQVIVEGRVQEWKNLGEPLE